jgi:hypothetical protein
MHHLNVVLRRPHLTNLSVICPGRVIIPFSQPYRSTRANPISPVVILPDRTVTPPCSHLPDLAIVSVTHMLP